jgi:hypothetical protein
MNTTDSNPVTQSPLARRATMFATAAALLFAPCLHAQTPDPAAKDQLPGKDLPLNHPLKVKLYTLKFDGGVLPELGNLLRETFPDDNFVIDGFDRQLALPPFELRKVRPEEIGRTLEFLTRGDYKVEIVSNEPIGNIWRIGPATKSAQAAAVKMRSVAAPSLFADEKALADIQESVREMEMRRLDMVGQEGGILRETRLVPLENQKIFVIIGDEEGVAGLESLIKAAEQRLAETANARAASLAANGPKMRAVLAPHVFAEEQRWKALMDEMQQMRVKWAEVNRELQSEVGPAGVGLPWVDIDARKEQKVFVLIGAEASIAGMESMIKAAEQLAAEEDALMNAKMEAIRRAEQQEADLKAAKEAAKEEKSDQ